MSKATDIQQVVDNAPPFVVATSKMLYDAPPVQYLIESTLPTHTICGLTGVAGTGKTWLAMEMMRAVVTGTKFLGQFQARQCPAVYIGSDASFLDYARQWRRLTKDAYDSYAEMGGEEGQRVENPFDSYAHFMLQSEFNLDDPFMIARLIRTSELVERPSYVEDILTDEGWEQEERVGRHYGLIIYDTLTKMTRTPENDNIGRDAVFDHLRVIAEITGATLVVLHHPPLTSEWRTGEEFRGAGSQIGDLDNHFHIVKNNGRDDVIQFKFKKFRGITPKPFLFELDVFKNEDEASLDYMEPIKDVKEYDDELQNLLVETLNKRANQPTTVLEFTTALLQHEIGKSFDGNIKKAKKRIQNFLAILLQKSDSPIVKIGVGPNRTNFYKLTPKKEEQGDEAAGD
jgi:hypothetical protein